MNYKSFYIEQLFKHIALRADLVVTGAALPKSALKNARHTAAELESIAPEVLDFYGQLDGLTLRWNDTSEEDSGGQIGIATLHDLLVVSAYSVEGEVLVMVNDDLDFSKHTQLTGVFHVLDRFSDEAYIGFFSDQHMSKQLFYCLHRYRFYTVPLDFESYFKLMCAAKGFYGWQGAILSQEYDFGKVEYAWFQERMTHLFPPFNIDEFIGLYRSLRKYPMTRPEIGLRI